jgi:hypothetical protein
MPDAELDLGLAKLRGVGGEDEVAHHRQLAAAAEREARHRRDHGLACAGELLPAGEIIVAIHLAKALRLHLLDVGAGGERLLAAGQHCAPLRAIGIERGHRSVELAQHLIVERVQRLWAVQRDQSHAALALLDQDGFVSGHNRFLLFAVTLNSFQGPCLQLHRRRLWHDGC